MAKARGTDPAEFKLRAVAMITDQGQSLAGVASQLGVTENCLHHSSKAVRQRGDGRVRVSAE